MALFHSLLQPSRALSLSAACARAAVTVDKVFPHKNLLSSPSRTEARVLCSPLSVLQSSRLCEMGAIRLSPGVAVRITLNSLCKHLTLYIACMQ